MISLLLPTVVLSTTTVLSLFALYAVRAGVFAPVAEAGPSLASADTIIGAGQMVQTVIQPRQPEWQTATLHSLTEVEDLLDCLEARGVASREVSVVNSGTFAVRWK